MHVELVPPTEALVAQLTFKRLLAWRTENRGRTGITVGSCRAQTTKTRHVEVTCVGFQVSLHVFLAILRLKSATCRLKEAKTQEMTLNLHASM